MTITDEMVYAAADAIAARGINPTQVLVRIELGDRGSYTTIAGPLKAWKAKRKAMLKPVLEPCPPQLSQRIGEVGAEIWAIALELASGRHDKERELLEQDREEFKAELKEATDLAEHLEKELEEVKAESAKASEQALAVQARLELQEKDIEGSKRYHTAAQARADENAKQIQDLNAELVRVNQQNSQLLAALGRKGKS